jgi:hypothetical protein
MRLGMVVLAFLCGPLVFWTPAGMRAVPTLALFVVLFMLIQQQPKQGLAFTVIYLSMLGGLRRWLMPALGWADQDPMLLLGPALALLYFVNVMLKRRVHRDSRLSRLLLWLLAIMFLEVFNPLQGGIGVGLAGIIFSIVPVLWYYLGRDKGSEGVINALLATVVGLSLLAAAYGLYQTWFGFLPSEMDWIKLSSSRYNALYVTNSVFHAFSFFTSAQEYVQFIATGVVILWAAFLRGMRIAIIPIPFLAMAIFYGGSRGPIVVTLAICMALWAVQGRSWHFWMPRLALAAVLAGIGLFSGLSRVQENSQASESAQTQDSRTQAIIDHQVNGLLDPNNSKTSTASSHVDMILLGIKEGFIVPVGRGLGATSIAASKFESHAEGVGSTEIDFSDNFVGLGFAGGLIYLSIIGVVLALALRNWRETRTLNALAMLGVLLISIGQWDHGGLYSLSMLVWFFIGALDRADQKRRLAGIREARQTEPDVLPATRYAATTYPATETA